MAAIRKFKAHVPSPPMYKFNNLPNKGKRILQQDLLFFKREHFEGSQKEWSMLLGKKANSFLKRNKLVLRLENITEGWLHFEKESFGAISVKSFLSFALGFINKHESALAPSLLTIRMDFKWYKKAKDLATKMVFIEKELNTKIVLSIEEWIIKFFSDQRNKTYPLNTSWYLTSTIVKGKVILVRKNQGEVEFKKVKLTSKFKCKIMFVFRDSHLAEMPDQDYKKLNLMKSL